MVAESTCREIRGHCDVCFFLLSLVGDSMIYHPIDANLPGRCCRPLTVAYNAACTEPLWNLTMKQFVIIGGNPRSGTNLARRIVGSHSDIALPPGEFQFFNQLAQGASLEKVLANPRLEKWGIDLSAYEGEQPEHVYADALQRYATYVGKKIPGEKTPSNEFHFAEIAASTADYDLRFIHMVRNPFDVMASYKHMKAMKGLSELNSIGDQMRHWKDSVDIAIERSAKDPERYTFVRYEDLAGQPIPTTEKLCEFIGVPFEQERMLGLADFADHKDNTSFPGQEKTGHSDYSAIKPPESRKHHLSAAEVGRVARFCGATAVRAGYEDDDFTKHANPSWIRRVLDRFGR